jgi:hypothetical protein
MSRYDLEPLESCYEIAVGWDPGLGNFFLQVIDRDLANEDDSDVDDVIVWLGADEFRTELDVDRVLAEAAKWAVLPEDLRPRLLSDQVSQGTRSAPFLFWARSL